MRALHFHRPISTRVFFGTLIFFLTCVLILFLLIISSLVESQKSLSSYSSAQGLYIPVAIQGRLAGASKLTSDDKNSTATYYLMATDKKTYTLQLGAKKILFIPDDQVSVTGTVIDNAIAVNSITDDGLELLGSGIQPNSPDTGYQVSGQVLNVGSTSTRPICPTTGYPGLNNAIVLLWGSNYVRTTLSARGGNNQDGAFYFQNVPPGMYNLCLNSLPQHNQWYCTVQSDPTRDPFNLRCNRISVAGPNLGNRLVASSTSCVNSDTAPNNSSIGTTLLPTSSPPCNFTNLNLDQAAQELEGLINAQRSSPVTHNIQLYTASLRHSRDMSTHNFFNHIGSDGSTPFTRIHDTGYIYTYAGEILARGDMDPISNEDQIAHHIFDIYWNSPPHKTVALDAHYHDIGCALTLADHAPYILIYSTCELTSTIVPTPLPSPTNTPTQTLTPTPSPTRTPIQGLTVPSGHCLPMQNASYCTFVSGSGHCVQNAIGMSFWCNGASPPNQCSGSPYFNHFATVMNNCDGTGPNYCRGCDVTNACGNPNNCDIDCGPCDHYTP